ncbi:hypothetical protein D1007_45055 [Hordeum vulgare]|nr:hypothetical protein D1007_45055 [Hordeum vulgare]
MGNLTLIQYMYWEKVQPIAVETYDPLSSEHPLMINWSEIEARKHDQYDTDNGHGHKKIDNIISEEYKTAKIAKEGIIPEKLHEPQKRKGGGKGNNAEASSSTDTTLDLVMKCIKDMQKEMWLIPNKCVEILIEKLNKSGLIFKPPNKKDGDDVAFLNKSGLFGIRDVTISTDHITKDHIEASKIYIQTLSKSSKNRRKNVVIMPGLGGESYTTEQLQAVIDHEWLNGSVINSYLNHVQNHSHFLDRHILSWWVSHFLLLRASGNVKN